MARLRPIAELGLEDPTEEEVACWKCGERMMVGRLATRIICPGCGSRVSVHRLQMPSLPTPQAEPVVRAKPGVEVVRLAEASAATMPHPRAMGSDERSGTDRMPLLENGQKASVLDRGGAPGFSSPERLPFAARRTTTEQRPEMFEEAEPRLDKVDGIVGMPHNPWMRVLAISAVLFVVLTLLAVVLALRG